MFDALRAETDRGKACVGDALLDEVVKELFLKRLLKEKKELDEMLGQSEPLGNHGARLKLAYLLGWIGPETYADSRDIRRIRNAMAHQLDVDSFDHPKVRDLVDGLRLAKDVRLTVAGQTKRVNLNLRTDKFLYTVAMTVMRYWWLIDLRRRSRGAKDPAIMRLPKPPESNAGKRPN
jgi:DNA-binding MltR family transcriptional regulator